jgi:hypothetical protein
MMKLLTSDPGSKASTHLVVPRRRVLDTPHKSLAIGLLLGLAVLPAPSNAVELSTDHDVVIVGGGASGLYAAYTLKNLGHDVLSGEASSRHGGRVYSDTLGDVGIERGAEDLYADSGKTWTSSSTISSRSMEPTHRFGCSSTVR